MHRDVQRDFARGARGRSAGGGSDADGETSVTPLDETIDVNDREAVFERLDRARREYNDLPYEKNLVIDSYGQLWELSGDTSTVDPFVLEQKYGVSLEGSFSYHNHPAAETHYSFSAEDVGTFCQSGERFSMASDDKFVYYMYRPIMMKGITNSLKYIEMIIWNECESLEE